MFLSNFCICSDGVHASIYFSLLVVADPLWYSGRSNPRPQVTHSIGVRASVIFWKVEPQTAGHTLHWSAGLCDILEGRTPDRRSHTPFVECGPLWYSGRWSPRPQATYPNWVRVSVIFWRWNSRPQTSSNPDTFWHGEPGYNSGWEWLHFIWREDYKVWWHGICYTVMFLDSEMDHLGL